MHISMGISITLIKCAASRPKIYKLCLPKGRENINQWFWNTLTKTAMYETSNIFPYFQIYLRDIKISIQEVQICCTYLNIHMHTCMYIHIWLFACGSSPQVMGVALSTLVQPIQSWKLWPDLAKNEPTLNMSLSNCSHFACGFYSTFK